MLCSNIFLFLSGNEHEDGNLFSLPSKNKPRAFMSASTKNIPLFHLTDWAKSTFIIQDDDINVKAISSGSTILDSGVELLSVKTLPKLLETRCQ